MILLASTTDTIKIVTSAAVATNVHASYADIAGVAVAPGRKNTSITTASTTTVVNAPAAGAVRTMKTLAVRNTHASTAQTVTVVHDDGTNAMELFKAQLAAGETVQYHEAAGFFVQDASGRVKIADAGNSVSPAINSINLVVLPADVVNNNATANTMQNVTGLSFAANANETYWFRFTIGYQAAATTTGSRWSISGPPSPTILAYGSQYSLTATGNTVNSAAAYDTPAASNASSAIASAAGGNLAIIEGIIRPSSAGTVIARFASEVASSAITAKAGSLLRWVRTL